MEATTTQTNSNPEPSSDDRIQSALNAMSNGPMETLVDAPPSDPVVEVKKEEEHIKPDLSQITEVERERFKEKRKFNQEKAALVRELEELKKAKEAPALKKEDTAEDELQRHIKKLLGEEEKPLTRAEVEKLFLEKEQAFEQKRQEQERFQQIDSAVKNFKTKIAEHLKLNETKSPLLANGLGDSEDVYAVIEADYLQKVEEFDEEYANSHLMPIEKATQLAENYLASTMKTMLKSKSALSYLKGLISEIEGTTQNPSSPPRTLSDDAFSNSAPSDGDNSEEARVRRAMAAMG